MKHHFYKCTTEPDSPNLTYRNHSNGLTGFRSSQTLNNYLGYKTIDEAEKQLERKKYTSHGRYTRARW